MEILSRLGLALAIVAAAAVLLFLVAWLIGSRLPIGHRASRTADLRASQERVWSEIVSESFAPGDARSETVEQVPPTRLVRRVVGETAYGGVWTFQLDAIDAGTARLTITEDGEVYNALYRFVSRFVIGHYRTIDTYIVELRRRLG